MKKFLNLIIKFYGLIERTISIIVANPFLVFIGLFFTIVSGWITIMPPWSHSPNTSNKSSYLKATPDIPRKPIDTVKSLSTNDTTFQKNVNSKLTELQKSVKDIEGLKNSVDSEKFTTVSMAVSKLNLPNETSLNSDDQSVIQMTEPAPKTGYGKIAFRSNCDYCRTTVDVTIDSCDTAHTEILKSWMSPRYNPENKRQTTFVKELMPGIYHVEFDYGEYGSSSLKVKVYKGKISLYTLKKDNPYGVGNGQLVLTTKNKHNWKISLDEHVLGIITLTPKKALFLNLPKEYYKLKIENLNLGAESLDLERQLVDIHIHEGVRLITEID